MNATETQTPAPARLCGCWCGEALNGKSKFRQGHDQRLVSRLAREVTDEALTPEAKAGLGLLDWNEKDDIVNRIARVADAVSARYSPQLGNKVCSAAERRWAKVGKEKPKAEATVVEQPKPARQAPAKAEPKTETAKTAAPAKPRRTRTTKAAAK